MFNFQKHRRNHQRLDEIPNSAAFGRMFRADNIPQEPPMVVFVPCHSLDLEAQIAHVVQRRLDTILIADSGSSVGVSLHSEDISKILEAQIKPLDISEIIGRNRSQR